MGHTRRFGLFDGLLYLFFILVSLIFIYPIWYCLITALSCGEALRHTLPLLWPSDFSLAAFKAIFSEPKVWMYYRNSVFYAAAGTVFSLTLTSLIAYPLIIKDFIGRKVLQMMLIITMFFSGGLLPYYFLVNALDMRNTVWVMLIPTAITVSNFAFNVIIFRTFFKNIPAELMDAAHMDGAGHYRVLGQIIIPVSKPLLATFGLFSLVALWNDWFTPYLFITEDNLKPIQVYLRETLIATSGLSQRFDGPRLEELNVVELNLKSAIVIITIIPIICVYPFVQKFFTKGFMIGSVK